LRNEVKTSEVSLESRGWSGRRAGVTGVDREIPSGRRPWNPPFKKRRMEHSAVFRKKAG